MARTPDQTHTPPTQHPHPHLRLLDEGLEAIAAGLARLLVAWDAARTDPAPLDPCTHAGLSVPAGKRPVSVTPDEASTCGRKA